MNAGDRIGRYVVESLLGKGGMGEVYRAHDDVLRRRVALKLLQSESGPPGSAASESNVKRVLREARMAAALDHPNVVAVFDVGEHEGTPFMVMELVSGTSLRALLAASIPVSERVRWLVDVARALAAAHRAGLVHRDIKPDNVLVREDGVVKVLDFGIARRDDSSIGAGPASSLGPDDLLASGSRPHEATREGASVLAGTPAYMAPEQIRGEPLDGRADQFAWGVMACEVLTGQRPWAGPADSVLSAVLYQEPKRLDGATLGIGAALVDAVARALEKSRDARFPSMDALLASMGVGANESTTAAARAIGAMRTPDAGSEPTALATRSTGSVSSDARLAVTAAPSRRRWPLLLVGATAVAAGALLGGRGLLRARRAPAPVQSAPPPATASAGYTFPIHGAHRITFDPGCEEFPTLTPDGRVVVYDATFGADYHLVARDIDGATAGAERVLTHDEGWQYSPALSPDGTRVAYVDQRGGSAAIRVLPLDGSAPPTLVREGGGLRPSWSPDGRALWFGPYELVERANLDTGEVTRRLAAPASLGIMQLLELPDGRVAARFLDRVTRHASGLGVYDAKGSLRMLSDAAYDETLTLAPDGAHLLVALGGVSGKNDLWEVPLQDPKDEREPERPAVLTGPVQDPTKGIAIAGDRVVWSDCRTLPSMYAIDAGAPAKSEPRLLFPSRGWDDDYPSAVPGSKTSVVVISDRIGRYEPWVLDTTGKDAPRMLDTGGRNPLNPAVSPDGRWLAFTAGGRSIYVMPFDGSGPPRRLTNGEADGSPTFARDGKTLYFQTAGAAGRSAIASMPLDGSAPATVVLERAKRPSASPTADTLAYSTDDGTENDEVRVFDLRARASAPASSHLPAGNHVLVHYAPDGRRILVGDGLQGLIEIAVPSGAIARRIETGDEVGGAAYVGSTVVFTQYGWHGDLWLGTRGEGKPERTDEPR
jgi:Tol biopolymer transport system component